MWIVIARETIKCSWYHCTHNKSSGSLDWRRDTGTIKNQHMLLTPDSAKKLLHFYPQTSEGLRNWALAYTTIYLGRDKPWFWVSKAPSDMSKGWGASFLIRSKEVASKIPNPKIVEHIRKPGREKSILYMISITMMHPPATIKCLGEEKTICNLSSAMLST